MKRDHPNKGSMNSRLASLEIGERLYIETDFENYKSVMRKIHTPISRRPKILEGRKFSTRLIAGVFTSGEVQYLIRVERGE